MVDGSPLGIAENNAGAIMPALEIPEDGVEETRVETQNTPASYQSGGAGVISLVTKSGTNTFHGDAFGVFRPDILAANEYFNKQSQLTADPVQSNTPPSFHRYQAGGAIGGPIIHNKLFFFGDYEYTDEQRFDGSNYFTVPTTAERTGDFSGDAFTIYNPLVPDNPDGTRQPFAGNKIPNPNPIALQFLSQMPKCNVGSNCDAASDDITNNFFAPGLDPTTVHRFDVRMDWMASDKQRIFGRFSFDRLFFSLFNAFGNMYDLNYAQNTTNGRNFLLADDITLNNSTVLQLRYSFVRHFENQGGDPRQVGFDITTLGFPSSLAAEQIYKGLPIIVFDDAGNGVGGTANWNTFRYASENNDITASITKLMGKHELTAGFEYMKRLLNVGQPPAASGAYAFDISATDQQTSPADGNPVGGSDFASLLIGQGEAPGNEANDYPNFTKDLFAAEANPYYAAFVRHVPSHKIPHPHGRLTLGHLRRQDGAAQPPRILRSPGAKHVQRSFLTRARRSMPGSTAARHSPLNLAIPWAPARILMAGPSSTCPSRRRRLLLWAEFAHGGWAPGCNSDRLLRRHAMGFDLFQRQWQHRHQRHISLLRSRGRQSRSQPHRGLLPQQSIPEWRRSSTRLGA